MKRLIPVFFILLLALLFVNGMIPQKSTDNFETQWKEVVALKKQGLPQSALKMVEKIYKKAKKQNNQPQLLKVLLYRAGLKSTFEEEYQPKTIAAFETELKTAAEPEKSILYSLLAQMYNNYFRQNRYKIMDRSVVEDTLSEDIRIWDAKRFQNRIKKYYLLSTTNESALKTVSLKSFSDILGNNNKEGFVVWPVLYDLLAQRAIDYFSSSEAELFDFTKKSLDTSYMVPVNEFVKINLFSKNPDSKTEVLRLFQTVLQFHLSNHTTKALVDADLKRLNFVKNHVADGKAGNRAYVRALKSLLKEAGSSEAKLPVAYALANFYFNTNIPEATFKTKNKTNNLHKAEKICKEAIQSYPQSHWAKAFQGMIDKIHRPSLNFKLNGENIPNHPILVQTGYRNMKKLYVKVVPTQFDIHSNQWQQQQQKRKKLLKQKGVFNTTIELSGRGDYLTHTAEWELPPLPAGEYILFLSNDKSFSAQKTVVYKSFQVTALSYLSKSSVNENGLDIYVLNRENGKTVGTAHITVYRQEYSRQTNGYKAVKMGDFTTDKNGFVPLHVGESGVSGNLLLHISKDNDNYYAYTQPWFWNNRRNPKPTIKTWLFTDRAIYRPGQIVYFKGIVTKKTENHAEVVQSKNLSVELLDANHKKLNSLSLRTNDFGSVQGSFVLPTGKLNGRFTLRTKNGSATFRVEEYKRPTFRVKLDTLTGKYRLNDKVTVTGHATDFAGSPVTSAKVQYHVTRKAFNIYPSYGWYRPFPQNKAVEITNGTLLTDTDGSFTIDFKALPDEEQHFVKDFYFTVSVEVTDVTGEVHTAETVLPIGENPYVLTIDIKNKIDREQQKGIVVTAKNLSGKAVNTEAVLHLYKITPPQRVILSPLWSKPDTVLLSKEKFKKDFPYGAFGSEADRTTWNKKEVAAQTIRINGTGKYFAKRLKTLSPGEYLITVKSTTKTGSVVKDKRFVTLYSQKSKTVPASSVLWFTTNKIKAEPGEIVKILLGTAVKNTRVLLEISSGNKQIKEEWITLGRKQKTVELPIKEDYRGNILIKVSSVRFNRNFADMQLISVPFSNKKLQITLETHRNFLTPGQKEEWRVNIKGYKGQKVAAELLTTMYDASLDQFAANRWNMQLFYPKPPLPSWGTNAFSLARGTVLYQPKHSYYSTPSIAYPHINWFGYRMGYGGGWNRLDKSMAAEMVEAVPAGRAPGATAQTLQKQPAFDEPPTSTLPEKPVQPKKEEVRYRQNFNETAFFYPQLHTDSLGNVRFSFTTPDALTEWKLMMLAHTRDLKTGTLIQNIKAHKDLMVLLNKPRFVRAGDVLDFSGKIVSFTPKAMHVQVTIEFYNPMDNSPLAIISGKSKTKINIELPKGESHGFSTKITIPQNVDLLAFRIKAIAKNFTDGMEDMLPVLPDKMLVTETMPMSVKGNSTQTFHFDKLINSGKTMQAAAIDNYRYTVEFSSHPIWYVVQALPYLAKPKYESAQNLFNRYYANTIASGIVTQFPKIKTVLEQWENSSPDAFLSNLQKNEQLKNILLDATPWVLEAENENEQKRRIALLFDMNNLSHNLDVSLTKLKNRQHSSGAWSWFRGMYDDRSVTQSIVMGFARLRKMDRVDPTDNQMVAAILKKAIAYLDNQITTDYTKLINRKKVSLKKKHISSMQIRYLYARTAFSDLYPVKEKNKQAFNYYAGQAQRYWLKENNYLQAMIAVVLERLQKRNEAEAILRSLTERSLESEQLGMYWRTENGWYWYQSPVETEVMIMEAYDAVMHDKASVEKMKIWLLKNKQANRWKTSSATANAIFGLLMRGDNLLKETKNATLVVGGKQLKTDKENLQAGTGYIQKNWIRKEIKPDMGTITITNPNRSIAWGAAYYQYFEKLDKIGVHQTNLQVQKNYFVEKLTKEGPVVEPLLPNQKLHLGQKVVIRLVIKADRAMEYIHLKDMRATTFEPVKSLSGTQFKGGLMYYENSKDASTDFFISRLPKGTHVLEYALRVTQKGSFSAGIATIQSLYAPEFAAHSAGRHLVVE